MRSARVHLVLLLLGGVLALGLVALAWAIGAGSSEAQQGAMQNCPQAGKWAISVWSGDDGMDTEDALATCGEATVAAAYYLDPQTQGWQGWFLGHPELSDLDTLNDMQGVIALGAAGAPSPTATPTPTPSPSPTPAVQQFTGRGQQVTPMFSLDSGLTIFRMTHDGDSNFAIWLFDAYGDQIDLLVNEIGPFDGSTALGIEESGNFVLDVSADGDWTISVEQPRPTTAPGLPQNFSGRGQQVSPFFELPTGLVVFRMTHDGDSNFAIWLFDADGERIDLLVNEIGPFDGSTAVGIDESGVYLLGVSADGNWTVSVE